MKQVKYLEQYILEAPAPHSKHLEAIDALNSIIRFYESQLEELQKSIEEKEKSK